MQPVRSVTLPRPVLFGTEAKLASEWIRTRMPDRSHPSHSRSPSPEFCSTALDLSEDVEPAEETAIVHDAIFGLVQRRLSGLRGRTTQDEFQNEDKREC